MLKEEEMVALQSPELEHITPEEEMVVIRDKTISVESQSKEGDTFYLISQRWWQQWLDYVNQDMTSTNANGYGSHGYESSFPSAPKRPSAIDNTDLIDDVKSEVSNMEIELHDTLVEGRDYILLPQEVWNKLYGWYGGGPILPRKAINSGFSQTDLSIEVYPLRLHLLLMPKGERAVVRISKKETVGELHKKSCEVFDLILDQAFIWDFYGNKKHALMNDMDKTLDDANIQMDQDILVEVHNDEIGTLNGSYTATMQENGSKEKDSTSINFDPSKSSVCSAEGSLTNKNISKSCASEFPQSQHLVSSNNDVDNLQSMNIIGTRGGTSVGLIGLQNLGNTCFMNSAIQCLVHTPEFARYFQEDYRKEINWKNPLGMVGELALAFGELLRKLWAPGRTPVSPKPFKTKLARFAPQFSGYNQHDSQELLAFLLDGLHEDLNRVKHKPYIKTKDADGRPDEEVADEYWANHIARNDSIIVDVCQGQYKSTLVCPVCGKISVTFDPFMYLSLPLQSASARTMTIVVFSSDGSALPTPFTVTVPKQGRCKDLIQSLSSACSLKNGERLLLAEIHGHTIHKFLEDPLLLLSTIKDDDRLAAYKVPKPGKSTTLLQFVHRREEIDSADGSMVWKPYGIPLISQVSCDGLVKSNDIKKLAHKLLLPMLHYEDNDEEESQDSKIAATSPGLHLVQDNECIDLTTEEKPLKLLPSSLSTSVMVYINWSQKDLMNYDTHFVENIPEVFKYAPAPKRIRGEPLSLYACLDAFLREEPLVPEDMWFCPRCKEQRQASKKLDLWRLPEVLVIHLKRFSFSRSSKNKLETYVNFPIHDLDLTNYVAHKKGSEQQLYELYALSNHYGTMASGHYTAHIKLLDENKWYNFDDSHISPISEEDVRTSAAYVLFYRRVKSEEVSPGNKDHHYAIQPSNSSRR